MAANSFFSANCAHPGGGAVTVKSLIDAVLAATDVFPKQAKDLKISTAGPSAGADADFEVTYSASGTTGFNVFYNNTTRTGQNFELSGNFNSIDLTGIYIYSSAPVTVVITARVE